MSTRDGDRLPHRRILTGSDLMIIGDRMPGKRYNGFIKSLFVDLVNSYFMINPIWRNGYERKEAMVN